MAEEHDIYQFLTLSQPYDTIIQKVISYKIEQIFVFELSLVSLKLSTHHLQNEQNISHLGIYLF